MIFCASPVWGLGCYLSSQPAQHFFAFTTSLDFEVSAILLAFSFKSAEEINEQLELVESHFIDGEIFGDIYEAVGVNIFFVECPDFIKGGATFAQATRHKGESCRFNRDMLVADVDIAVFVISGIIMDSALYTEVCAHRPFAFNACVDFFIGGDGVDSVSSHLNRPFVHFVDTIIPQRNPRVYSHNAQIASNFFVQVATSSVIVYNNVDRFCASCTKIFLFVRLHKKRRRICASCQNNFLCFAQKSAAMLKIFVQAAQKSGFSSHCTEIGVFERNFCALYPSAKTARLDRRRAAEKKREKKRAPASLSFFSFLSLLNIHYPIQ